MGDALADLALITTLNEEGSIEELVTALRALGLDVLVIDAGSSDDTMAAARHGGAIVRSLPGASTAGCLLAGWRMALHVPEYGALVQIASGGRYDPTDALGLLRALVCADVVVGSRLLPGGRFVAGRWQRWSARAASMACNVRAGADLSDWTSGFRAFSRRALGELVGADYRARSYGFQIEALGRALSLGLRVAQAPVGFQAWPAAVSHAARDGASAWARLPWRAV